VSAMPGPAPGVRLRVIRGALAGIWLVYFISPVAVLFSHHYSALYIAGALALLTAFSAIFIALVVSWECAPYPLLETGLAALAVLAVVGCLVYGQGATTMWLFVSSTAGWVIRGQRRAIWAVMAAAVCYVTFSLITHVDSTDLLLNLLTVVLVGIAIIGFRAKVQLTRELTQARETVARMAANEERLRLARDLHDLTGQSLSMITLKSELAARLLQRLPEGPDRDRARDEIEQVAAVSRQTLHDIREAISGYRRPTLAVEIITARTALEAAGIMSHDDPEITLLSGTFGPDAEAALAWCLREAVTNVVRHSRARNCHISLTRRAGSLALAVRDDGRGEVQPATATGTGLHGMSERLCAAGGRLELRPGPDGFGLIASVPERDSATVAV
jgi:two-component system, NarL family, sensor histidine kinase DesK